MIRSRAIALIPCKFCERGDGACRAEVTNFPSTKLFSSSSVMPTERATSGWVKCQACFRNVSMPTSSVGVGGVFHGSTHPGRELHRRGARDHGPRTGLGKKQAARSFCSNSRRVDAQERGVLPLWLAASCRWSRRRSP